MRKRFSLAALLLLIVVLIAPSVAALTTRSYHADGVSASDAAVIIAQPPVSWWKIPTSTLPDEALMFLVGTALLALAAAVRQTT